MVAAVNSGDRFARNLLALRHYMDPGLFEKCAGHRNRHVQVAYDANGAFHNLLVGSAPLYQPDGPTYIAERLSEFARNPQQIRFADNVETPTRFENLASVAAHMLDEFARTRFAYQPPVFGSVGSMVSLGVGAGGHLERLVERAEFADLIVVEPQLEIFIASLHVCDWVSLLESLVVRDGTLTLVIEQNPAASFEAVLGAMRHRSFALIEGSYVFIHDTRPEIVELLRRIAEAGPNIISYNGWLEDELRHACNHALNVSGHERAFLRAGREDWTANREGGKLFVVTGSGPSLGENIDVLARSRDDIVLVSAGTSLRPLLNAGIRPDYHCELENVDTVSYLLSELQAQFGLSGITLIASTTVDPRVPNLFDETIFYVREGDGVMPLLGAPIEQVGLVGPSSVNTGVVLAGWLGASAVLLLGADFGRPVDAGAYTDGVAYQELSKINAQRREQGLYPLAPSGSTAGDMQIAIQGNADVNVLTNNVLTMMRHRLEVTIGILGLRVWNMGRGARIGGADPRGREDFSLLAQQLAGADKGVDRAVIVRRSGADFAPGDRLTRLGGAIGEALDSVVAFLRDLLTADGPFGIEDLRQAFASTLLAEPQALVGESPEARAARVALSGSMLRLFHGLRHAYLRLSDTDRPVFARHAAELLIDMLPIIRDESATVLANAVNAAAAGADPRETDLARLFRSIKANEVPTRELLENGLFAMGAAKSIFLAQFILSNTDVAQSAQHHDALRADTWYLELLARSSQPLGSYSWYVKRCFSLLRIVDDRSVDPAFLIDLDRNAEAIAGERSSEVYSQAAQYHLLAGNAERSLHFAELMSRDPTPYEKRSILLGNIYFLNGRLEDAVAAFADAGLPGGVDIVPPNLDLFGAALVLKGRVEEGIGYYRRNGELSFMGRIVASVLAPERIDRSIDLAVDHGVPFVRKITRLLNDARKAWAGNC